MNANTVKDTTNTDGKNTPNTVKNLDQKPCFTTSSAIVFTNLHNAAVEAAAKQVGIAAGDKNINQFIINSGMSDDGRTISDSADRTDQSKLRRWMSSGGKFEVGIVLEVNATPLMMTSGDGDDKDLENQMKKNQKAVDNAKKIIERGLRAYMRVFCGSDRIGPMEEFIPDYNGGKVQVEDGVIVGIKEYKDVIDPYVSTTGQVNATTKKEVEVDPSKKLRIGYKIGYTITYK